MVKSLKAEFHLIVGWINPGISWDLCLGNPTNRFFWGQLLLFFFQGGGQDGHCESLASFLGSSLDGSHIFSGSKMYGNYDKFPEKNPRIF